MEKAQFYDACAELLGVGHQGPVGIVYEKRTRWNNREPGSGRFPGRGVIRHYGTTISVVLSDPPVQCAFETEQAVLDFLRTVMAR